MKASKLDELRQDIDQLDQEMISLLAKRFQLTEEVGIYKATHKLAAQDSGREQQQFDKIRRLAESRKLDGEHASVIYRCIMDLAIARHKEIEQAHKESASIL
ncbi:chorismate mutase [Paenibacillus endophyticus]|uniref:Chorismate mutase n=1 Tax=Paenibacillus endophyticus TaxID=1294268 RepID=A0A7W5G969_9BACL|nr:chorismate mutase [Paenibacillus endophyticus]MBB3151346.1 chorismate mutase [Paenibacillus endophyticus]